MDYFIRNRETYTFQKYNLNRKPFSFSFLYFREEISIDFLENDYILMY